MNQKTQGLAFLVLMFFLTVKLSAQWVGTSPVYYTTGNVGIGVSNPQSILDVKSGLQQIQFLTGTNTSAYRLEIGLNDNGINFTNNSSSRGFNFSNNTHRLLTLTEDGHVGVGTATPSNAQGWNRAMDINGATSSKLLVTSNSESVKTGVFSHFSWNGAPTGLIGTESQHPLMLMAGYGNGVMTLSTNGNVGIGITSPSDKLHLGDDSQVNLRVGRWGAIGVTGGDIATIVGNNVKASTSVNSQMEYITETNDGGRAIRMRYDQGISFHTFFGHVVDGTAFSGYERMRIDNNGNVGIGISSPVHKLQIYSSNNPTLAIGKLNTNTNGKSTLRFYAAPSSNAGNGFAIEYNKDVGKDYLTILNGGNNEVLTATNIGNVGIGTTAPEARLEVKGNSAVYSDFAGYSGTTTGFLPNGKAPSLIISEEPLGTLVSGVGGQNTYRGGLSFGLGGPGIYSVNPNPAGSPYYGDIRFQTTYWNGTGYSNADRMIIDHKGNVGIGTISPSAKLDIEENIDGSTFIEVSNSNPGNSARRGITMGDGSSGNSLSIFSTSPSYSSIPSWQNSGVIGTDFGLSGGLAFYASQGTIKFQLGNFDEKIVFDENGKVGIGTTTPEAKLDVNGDAIFRAQDNTYGIAAHIRDLNGINSMTFRALLTKAEIVAQNNRDFVIKGTNDHIFFYGKDGGNVGIGTTDPGTYKLAVEGQIGARSVKVTQAAWADYVFAPSYELMPLEDVEAYIQKNQHLPNVASANEIEHNGFVLEEMDAKLMEKIEELTLYVIELQKQDKEQKDRIKSLEVQNSRVERLEKELRALKDK